MTKNTPAPTLPAPAPSPALERAEAAEEACCEPSKKATCCEPSQKASCCGPRGNGKKGCC